jgi:hypothetical protein
MILYTRWAFGATWSIDWCNSWSGSNMGIVNHSVCIYILYIYIIIYISYPAQKDKCCLNNNLTSPKSGHTVYWIQQIKKGTKHWYLYCVYHCAYFIWNPYATYLCNLHVVYLKVCMYSTRSLMRRWAAEYDFVSAKTSVYVGRGMCSTMSDNWW